MKTNPYLKTALYLSLLAWTGMTLFAQPDLPVGAPGWERSQLGDDTNSMATAIAKRQEQVAPAEARVSRLFAHATNQAAALAAAEKSRQAALALRPVVREEIELLQEGAIARFGPHQVIFPPAMPGMITLHTPDGKELRSQVLGLAYLSDSGKSLLLAELKASEGELVGERTVIYRDAFDDVKADLVYEYTRNSFEQLIVLRHQLPAPEELGFSAEENVQLTVLTEWFNPPPPQRVAKTIDLQGAYRSLGMQRKEALSDETVSWGTMRMIHGRSFTLGEPEESVPSGKQWEVMRDGQGVPRQFLLESTPYRLLKPQLDALPDQSASLRSRKVGNLKTALLQLKAPAGSPNPSRLMARAEVGIEAAPGVVLDYLIVTTPLLNVNFGWSSKYGYAAIGQETWDYWNPYYYTGYDPGWVENLTWSDWSSSAVGMVVSNATEVGYNPLCTDSMYQYFIHPGSGGPVTVTLTNLPADIYDVFVYATRASDAGAPVIELKQGGTTLWTKATTYWGKNWYANPWEEHEQYVRFRRITVTNQTLTLVSHPDAAGYASLSGLQLVPSDALPSETPTITQLLNINFPGNTPDKVGYAAVGQSASDFWNEVPNATAGTTTNLKWANNTSTTAGITVLNAPGAWGFTSVPDLMYQNYIYSHDAGNVTLLLTNLPSGTCDFYLYGHTTNYADNGIFELWSGGVNWGTKGTSIHGPGPATTNWQVGQQFVLFKGVAVVPNQPVIIHAKHNSYGYQNVNGLQIAYTGGIDSDADGLPDEWELKWLGGLGYAAYEDPDNDELSNLREYQLGLDPLRYDSDSNGWPDGWNSEFSWLEDATPQGGYQSTWGGDNWNWVTDWYDGDGWYGWTIYPQSGTKMRVSARVSNALHQHSFDRAVSVIRPGTGDMLYAWINLDLKYPPAEVMLQFQTMEANGSYSWDHRAYWGENRIAFGQDGTASRYPMGALPEAGQWVRLEVPASVVGLEGKIIEGVTFTLWGGRAAWDSAGVFNPDLDGDGWLDSIERYWFGGLSQSPAGDYDGDGLPNIVDAEPGSFDTSPPVFEILTPSEGAVL